MHPACVLLSVCSLHFTLSLHFTPGPQSAFYTDRLTVADLDGIAVEDFFEFVLFREVFVYEGEESVTDVGVDVFAEWGVVPEDVVALSVSPFSSCRRFVV